MIPLPYKLLALVFILIGAVTFGYMKGAANAERVLAEYRAKAEKQISDLKDENAKISGQVTTEFVDRTNTIREKEIIYRESASNLQSQYDLSKGWIHLHDVSAKMINPDANLASDSAPSGIMDNTALAVVISNYAICHQNAEQLKSLQKWITENQKAVNKANGEGEK
jgi:hypothetical protein